MAGNLEAWLVFEACDSGMELRGGLTGAQAEAFATEKAKQNSSKYSANAYEEPNRSGETLWEGRIQFSVPLSNDGCCWRLDCTRVACRHSADKPCNSSLYPAWRVESGINGCLLLTRLT
jgi:hypothetical protein